MARSEMRLSGSPANTGFAEGQAGQCPSARHLPEWLHGNISRRCAEDLLQGKPTGCFLVRFSESRNGYTLSYRIPGQFRHFMIDVMPDSRCIISGDSRVHRSLQELVSFHTQIPISPYVECLTVPCSQVKAGSGEPCSLGPALGKEGQKSPPGCSSAANISPRTPPSASPATARPRLLPKPPKFQAGPEVAPPLPAREGMVRRLDAHRKPALPVPVTASDDSRRPIKKLYPSIEMELNALLLGNQLPSSTAATAFGLPAATLPRQNSEVTGGGDGAQRDSSTEGQKQETVASQDEIYSEIPADHHARGAQDQPPTRFPQGPSLRLTPQGHVTSSPGAGSEGVGGPKGQTAPLFKEMLSKFSEIKHLVNKVKQPEPQRHQPGSPRGSSPVSAANHSSATRPTNLYSPLHHRRQESCVPQQVSTLHAPSHTRADTMAPQPPSHVPPLSTACAKTQFAEESPSHGRDKLNTCTEGQAGECFGGSGRLPEEYLIPPPYAPGYNPSSETEAVISQTVSRK